MTTLCGALGILGVGTVIRGAAIDGEGGTDGFGIFGGAGNDRGAVGDGAKSDGGRTMLDFGASGVGDDPTMSAARVARG